MSPLVLGVALVVVGGALSVASGALNRDVESWSSRWVSALLVLCAGIALFTTGASVLVHALGIWRGAGAALGIWAVVVAVCALGARARRRRWVRR